MTVLAEPSTASDVALNCPDSVRLRPAITFKVYGVRVVHTETAVHVAFGQFLRDPDAGPCACGVCVGEAQASAKWQGL